MQLCLASSSLITRPDILFRHLYHLRSNRIQNDIATDFQQVTVLLDQNGTVPPLEQMTVPAMPFIEQLGIYSVQLAHSERQVAVRSFDKKMIVIGHQAIGVTDPVVALINTLERVQKVLMVSVVFENRLLLICREVTWQTAPGYSMRRGRDMAEEYQKKGDMSSRKT